MLRKLLSLLCFTPFAALAAITPLPGSTEQHAPVNQYFQAVRVLVTNNAGNPIAGATVRWVIPLLGLSLESTAGCIQDAGYNCATTADSQGVATLTPVRASPAGVYSFQVITEANGVMESTVIFLIADPLVPPASLTLSSGGDQRAVIGTPYAAPFVVRAVKSDGQPLAGANVSFQVVPGGPDGAFANPMPQNPRGYIATTDAAGYATSSTFTAGWGIGAGEIDALLYDEQAQSYVLKTFGFTNTAADGSLFMALRDMWWSGPTQNGWGLSIAQHGGGLFTVVYAYDSAGNPTWWVMPFTNWRAGLGSSYSSAVYSPRSAPFFAYDVARFQPGNSVGTGTISFNGPDAATLGGVVDGINMNKTLVRQDFSPTMPGMVHGVGDMWYGGPPQNGWGVAIEEQMGNLFAVWYTYDENGLPTWFVMPEGTWNESDRTWAGSMYQTKGSPWLGAAYDASQFRIVETGTFTIHFVTDQSATLAYSIKGRSGTLTMQRQSF